MRQLLDYHPVIGHTFVANLKARVEHESGGYLVRTNSSGFRCNHEFEPHKAPGIRRVMLFGDSFTAGDGVANQHRWSDLLEKRVPQLEVYNFGLSATGTDQQYLAYREFGREIEHDLLIISVLVENIRRIVSRYREYRDDAGKTVIYAKPYFEMKNGALESHNIPVAKRPIPPEQLAQEAAYVYRGGRFQTARRLIKKLGLREIAQKLTRYQPVPGYDRPDHPSWLLMRAILRQWITEHNGPVMLFPIPLYQFIEQTSNPSAYQARFQELAAETGCLLHDPLADLQRYSAEERRGFRHKSDVHPTITGHAALADSLAPAVERAFEASQMRVAK